MPATDPTQPWSWQAPSRMRPARDGRVGLLGAGGQPLVDGGVEHGPALAAVVGLPRQGRARGEDRLGGHARHHLAGRPDVDQHRVGLA